MDPKITTDKHASGLIRFYEREFAQLRDKPLKILELGIHKGGSLLWMAEWFHKAQIVGIDRKLPNIKHERITMFRAGQGQCDVLAKIASEQGPFDFIIDDCSHRYAETLLSFDVLEPHLKDGGRYFVEDWCAGFELKHPYRGVEKVLSHLIETANRRRFRVLRVIKTKGERPGSVAVLHV